MLYIRGMMGLGDNLHQRAVMIQLAKNHEDIFLETPWPSLYWDIPQVKPVRGKFTLRTQAKNSVRESSQYVHSALIPKKKYDFIVHYTPNDVRRYGSVCEAMCRSCGVLPIDFALTLKPEWIENAKVFLHKLGVDKPILIYRPLVERTEWGGCANRNPDIQTYIQLFESFKDQFFVISIADLEDGKEWMTSPMIEADATFHKGELNVNMLAGIFHQSALVYNSPGFSTVLAQSVRTPNITVFGGYEDSHSFAIGAKYSPYLGIDPIHPCQCFSHSHACQKTIDVDEALIKIQDFIHANCHTQPTIHHDQANSEVRSEGCSETVFQSGRTGNLLNAA